MDISGKNMKYAILFIILSFGFLSSEAVETHKLSDSGVISLSDSDVTASMQELLPISSRPESKKDVRLDAFNYSLEPESSQYPGAFSLKLSDGFSYTDHVKVSDANSSYVGYGNEEYALMVQISKEEDMPPMLGVWRAGKADCLRFEEYEMIDENTRFFLSKENKLVIKKEDGLFVIEGIDSNDMPILKELSPSLEGIK